jgi:hypothetical protein
MSQHDGGFGRRGMQPAGRASRPVAVPSVGGGIPPLFKQVGGIALGVALAFAIGGAWVHSMKQAGKSVERNFVAQMNAGNPAAVIEQFGDDATLKRVDRVCTGRAAGSGLTEAQRRATNGNDSIYIVELRLAYAAAYVACLTREEPQRFCQKPQRDHLFEAVRQYFNAVAKARGEWQLQMQMGNPAMITGPIDVAQGPAMGLPSTRMDTQLQDGLVALDAGGYIPAGDLARLLAPGSVPRGMPPLPQIGSTSTQSRKAACG